MNKEVTAVIVDDEEHCRSTLTSLLARLPGIKLVGTATSLVEGTEVVSRTRPDILFLDVEIGDRTGFDLLQTLGPSHPHVIFTTAHEGYALKAIRFSALDFLLKPIDEDELAAAIAKVHTRAKEKPNAMAMLSLLSNMLHLRDGQLFLPTEGGLQQVGIGSVDRIHDNDGCAVLHLEGGGTLQLATGLKECEDLLAEHGFIRAQRTVLVNVQRIVSLRSSDAMMRDGSSIQIDPLKLPRVKELMSR